VTPRAAGVLLLLAALSAVLAAQTALASGPTIPARHTGGYVPAHGAGVNPNANPNNLTYHGGPVMRVNKTYAVYWQPPGYSFSANYKTLINRYFADVAAASGATTNVYSVETQYYDTTGPIAYSSTFGGSVTDTRQFPANAYVSCGGPAKCLSDAQIQSELQTVIGLQGWTENLTTQFFMFTPNNVGSCDGFNSCSFTAYCAYHGYSGNLIYANQPYAAYSSGCTSGERPNGDPADDTINVASHEHREAINDEHLDAWYNPNYPYNEGSDQCAWMFGSPLGGGQGAEYNQIINGNHYYVQQEWSNDGSTCLLQYSGGGGPSPPTVTSFIPTSGPVGTSVSITGTGFTGATSVAFNGVAASFTFNSDTNLSATVPSGATTGPISVTTPNGTGTSASSFTITGGGGNPPAVTSFTPTSGPVGTSVSITGTGFTGVTAVTFNGVAASFTFNSDTNVSATVPSGATTGPISVTTGNGTGTSASNFTVTTSGGGAPKITSFTPTQGFPGTIVTITGTNFTGATSVRLGNVSATFTVMSATTIKATTPNVHLVGSYRWSVTTPNGTATSTQFFRFL
jgi:hypothetical protein